MNQREAQDNFVRAVRDLVEATPEEGFLHTETGENRPGHLLGFDTPLISGEFPHRVRLTATLRTLDGAPLSREHILEAIDRYMEMPGSVRNRNIKDASS